MSRFSDPFLGLEFFATEFGVTVKHLRNVSLAQRGRFKTRHNFSAASLSRYPRFVKGPGGKLGMYASKYRRWRNVIGSPLEAA